MEIKIKSDDQTLVLTNEGLDTFNFVDIVLYDEKLITEDNSNGFVAEMTVPLSELRAAVELFNQIKKDNDDNDK